MHTSTQLDSYAIGLLHALRSQIPSGVREISKLKFVRRSLLGSTGSL